MSHVQLCHLSDLDFMKAGFVQTATSTPPPVDPSREETVLKQITEANAVNFRGPCPTNPLDPYTRLYRILYYMDDYTI